MLFPLDAAELYPLADDCCKPLPLLIETDYSWVTKQDSYLPKVLETHKNWTEQNKSWLYWFEYIEKNMKRLKDSSDTNKCLFTIAMKFEGTFGCGRSANNSAKVSLNY